ncbi:MAG TPA: MoxR family ATPase, partial [Gemmatimonadaceae bacterium]|nr:MoxR family ATPase [Gemmatimonadaceae bacterium]
MPLTIQEGASLVGRIRDAIGSRILGQDDAITDVLAAFLARGHLLIEGVPGTAKTLLARTLARVLDVRFGRIQFTPDLMPADVTGISMYRENTREFEFQPGPVFTDILLADEINRAPAKTQAALLEAMAERQVTVDGKSRPLTSAFTVLATQNPVEHEGTFPLPEAQLDRFLLKVVMTYPSLDAELAMLELHESGFDPEQHHRGEDLKCVATASQVSELRELADGVRIAPEVRGYIAAITRATRDDPSLSLGASPRATVALMRVARAGAVIEGRDFVTPDDVKARAVAALRHRVTLAPEVEVEGRGA